MTPDDFKAILEDARQFSYEGMELTASEALMTVEEVLENLWSVFMHSDNKLEPNENDLNYADESQELSNMVNEIAEGNEEINIGGCSVDREFAIDYVIERGRYIVLVLDGMGAIGDAHRLLAVINLFQEVYSG